MSFGKQPQTRIAHTGMNGKDAEIARLRMEIDRLRTLLREHGIPVDLEPPPSTPAPPAPQPTTCAIRHPEQLTEKHALLLYSLFRGRKDVYSTRNVTKDGKSVYYPVCTHFWQPGLCPKRDKRKVKCMECPNRAWAPLTQRVLLRHLRGERIEATDVVGIYPLLPDETCRFLVFDFDNHGAEKSVDESSDGAPDLWEDVDAMRRICRHLRIPCLVERSRSGRGAHVWLLFSEAIPASLARSFGASLLTKGAEFVNLRSFRSYDRMLPAQDHMPAGGLGNLVALPLQGKALREGNSAFLDENGQPYADQWGYLAQVEKISRETVETCVREWCGDGELGLLSEATAHESEDEPEFSLLCEPKPWVRTPFMLHTEDVEGTLVITRADQIYIPTAPLKPRIQNTLRRLAAFQNPLYYKRLAMGYSVRDTPRIIACHRDLTGYIALPRGKWEELHALLQRDGVPHRIRDERQRGRNIKVVFQGELYPEQQRAADKMAAHETGILHAATAFGKTAVGANLIARHGVNTLILVHNREIMKNWLEDIPKFLDIRETPPTYSTPSGRTRRRRSALGSLHATHDSLTGIIDVAMVTSLGKGDEIKPLVREYGMVIMDECHHGAAQTIEEALRNIPARYVYGLTATPKRDDGMEQKVTMQFGCVRHRFTAREKAALQGISHFIRPRFTRMVNLGAPWTMQEAYRELIGNEERNALIVEDALACIQAGKTPLLLTKFKEHAETLRRLLAGKAPNLFVLHGGRSSKESAKIRQDLYAVPESEPLAVIAIGQYIGEGFNLPRLDVLMLTVPISFAGNVEQYVGRLHRNYEGKTEVTVYDYVDIHIRMLESMYQKRLTTYRKIGYSVRSELRTDDEAETARSIYDGEEFFSSFWDDVARATRSVEISSPRFSQRTALRLIRTARLHQIRGVRFSVLVAQESISPQNMSALSALRAAGVTVHELPRLHECFAVVDGKVVWYGNVHFLTRSSSESSMIRLVNADIANELLRTLALRTQDSPKDRHPEDLPMFPRFEP